MAMPNHSYTAFSASDMSLYPGFLLRYNCKHLLSQATKSAAYAKFYDLKSTLMSHHISYIADENRRAVPQPLDIQLDIAVHTVDPNVIN